MASNIEYFVNIAVKVNADKSSPFEVINKYKDEEL